MAVPLWSPFTAPRKSWGTYTFSLSKEKVLPISFSTWGRHRDVPTRWPFKEGLALICRECSQQMTFTVSSFRSCLDTPVTQLPLGLIHVQKLSKSGIWKRHHFGLMGTSWWGCFPLEVSTMLATIPQAESIASLSPLHSFPHTVSHLPFTIADS